MLRNWPDLEITKWTIREQFEEPIQKDRYVLWTIIKIKYVYKIILN
jgi:hypothetical protein